MYLPTQEDGWSLSKNHHYNALYTQPEDDDDYNKVGGTSRYRLPERIIIYLYYLDTYLLD